jgi:hypothetical protein
MPAKLESCVKEVKKQARKDHPEWDDKRVNDYAYATCVKSTGQHPSDEEGAKLALEEDGTMKWVSSITTHESFDSALSTLKRPAVKVMYGLEEARFDYLEESAQESDTHFYIVGDAIHPITTSNLHTYLAEELEAAAPTLAGQPVMVDHAKKSEGVAGKVLVAAWEERAGLDGTISYIARIRKSHPVAEAVKVGDISTVSIGAVADVIECSICSKDMRHCSHHIGKSYETDGEGVLATAIGRGLTFRELSVTPFPADPRASANVTYDSMFSAMEMLVESSEYKTQLRKAGVEHKMSEDNNEELALAEEIRSLKAEKEQLHKDKEDADKEIELFREREKTALVDRVFEMEVVANISKSEDEKVRKTELKAKSTEVLQAKIDDLKKFSSILEKIDPPRSKAVVAENPVEKKSEVPPLTYAREEIKSGLRQALGDMRTSESAKKTVRRWALDSQNPHYQEYQALVKSNITKALGRNE